MKGQNEFITMLKTKQNTDVSMRIEKDVNKSFTIFDLIYQLILNNETIQSIIHKKSKSPKINVKKTFFWYVFNEFFFFSMYNN